MNTKEYVDMTNQKLNDIKIKIECSEIFCVTYVYNFDDSFNKAGKPKRVFVDFIMKRIANLNAKDLSQSQKKCAIDFMFDIDSQKTSVYEACDIQSDLSMLPVKRSCLAPITDFCSDKADLRRLVSRLANWIDTPKDGNSTCLFPPECIKEGNSTTPTASCGSVLSDMYINNGVGISFDGLMSPCRNTKIVASQEVKADASGSGDSVANSTGNNGTFVALASREFSWSFIQMAMGEEDEMISEEEMPSGAKAEYQSIDSKSEENAPGDVTIDGSTSTSTRTDIEGDLEDIYDLADGEMNGGAFLNRVSVSLMFLCICVFFL